MDLGVIVESLDPNDSDYYCTKDAIIISGDFDILGLSYKASLAHQQYQSTQYQIFPTTL